MKALEFSGKTVDDALSNALKELKVEKDRVEYEVIEEGSKGLLGIIGTKPALIRVTVKKNAPEEATRFLSGVLDSMGIVAEIKVKEEDDVLRINLSGPKMGLIIGYRGETLDSLQYLTSLVVNKISGYKRVVLDTEGYRQKREDTLKRLADKTAYKVKKYGRSMKLEPMNPYERRIIHSALQGVDSIKTYSVGDEPYRRVVVELDK
ncbi:RNA-binding cell elongation regulator Jag/EloR [Youngiibacter multivorans]|uniref:RNA-binding protein KhpB n=1 Tax=Youngiibacter multivorans TaxID=937251 RepID=A0ABS4FZ38_9CLOT|nr:RNA-binding cell elongation regulator Jag/EloR [Youngiibacter multivorans]MBP1917549.1 spoIIIJ-associated protein [Youngiibacter multivorans]